MMEEQEALLRKALESVRAAKLLLENSLPDFAASRAYYAMFYVASAMLIGTGERFSKHSAAISAFGRCFVKSGQVDARFHRYLIDAQDNRIIGDYSSTQTLTDAQATELISQAEEFLALADNLLGSPPETGSVR
jgi:uncharacterized protein (UPF0332 family)